jgi:hypothetical protein
MQTLHPDDLTPAPTGTSHVFARASGWRRPTPRSAPLADGCGLDDRWRATLNKTANPYTIEIPI